MVALLAVSDALDRRDRHAIDRAQRPKTRVHGAVDLLAGGVDVAQHDGAHAAAALAARVLGAGETRLRANVAVEKHLGVRVRDGLLDAIEQEHDLARSLGRRAGAAGRIEVLGDERRQRVVRRRCHLDHGRRLTLYLGRLLGRLWHGHGHGHGQGSHGRHGGHERHAVRVRRHHHASWVHGHLLLLLLRELHRVVLHRDGVVLRGGRGARGGSRRYGGRTTTSGHVGARA